MLYSLAELNDFVNAVTNHIVERACMETDDTTFRFSLDDIDLSEIEHIIIASEEDLYEYAELIASELMGRKELTDVDYHDHEFFGTCNREYCPNLYDHKPNEPLHRFSQPLSMSELATIAETAIQALDRTGVEGLHETLGMSFHQLHQLGYIKQNHYFNVGNSRGINTFWSADVDRCITVMRQECEKGTNPYLYFNKLVKKGDFMRIPMSKESCGKMVGIPTEPKNRPHSADFEEAAAKIEATSCDLPIGHTLSYRVSAANALSRVCLTLDEAVDAFQTMVAAGKSPHLSTQMATRTGRTDTSDRLIHEGERTILYAKDFVDDVVNPVQGGFYPKLARLAFPDRQMDIDDWRIRVVAPDERHGRNGQLINDQTSPIVEFRSMSSTSPDLPEGTLVSTVDMDFLVGRQGKGGLSIGQSFVLDANIPAWTLTAEQLAPVLTWLRLKDIELSKEKPIGLNDRIKNAQELCQGGADRNQPIYRQFGRDSP